MILRQFMAVMMFSLLTGGMVPGFTGSARGGEPEWAEVDSIPDHSTFTYDKSAVARPAPGMVKVLTRLVYLPEGKAETLELLGNARKYEGLAVSFFTYDIDCKGVKSRLTRVMHRDGEGKAIAEFDLAGKTDWEEIPPDSRLDMIREAECK